MERFAAMVIGHRAAAAHVPAPAPAAQVEAKGKGKGKRKGKVVEEDAAYLSIQLEEIVIVKNNDVASLGATRGRSTLTSGASASMVQRVAAAAAPPSGMSAAAAAAAVARGALSTTAGWIVGSDELRSRVFA